MALLTAPAIVIVPAMSASAPAKVEYASGVDLTIRERINGLPWRLRSLETPPNDLRHGSYDVFLKPGEKYEAEAYRRDTIPPGFPADATGTDLQGKAGIRAILANASANFPFTEPFSPEVGGTYWWARVATPPLNTFLVVQIGSTPPVPDGDGFLRIPNAKFNLQFDESTVHDVEIEPLIPGNDHHFVVTILDVGSVTSTGRWEQIRGSFTTKLRTTFILFKDLVITDDSDPGAIGEGIAGPGRFAFQVREMGDGQSRVDRDFQFTIQSFTDKAPQNVIDLSPYGLAHVVSPKPLTPQTEHLGIALRGVEEDTGVFFDTDDIAETLFGTASKLELPTGRFKENFTGKIQKIYALPRSGADDFTFHVHVEYAAFYS